MPKMTFTQPRATLDELLQFANAVREAGGGNPLDALMPAVPEDPSQCLIAKNLNFNCSVDGNDTPDGTTQWVMYLEDIDVAQRIGEQLDLEVEVEVIDLIDFDDDGVGAYILLPKEIGQVAADFDRWDSAIDTSTFMGISTGEEITAEDKQRFRDFWPYVEASQREAYNNATFVNERGELIL